MKKLRKLLALGAGEAARRLREQLRIVAERLKVNLRFQTSSNDPLLTRFGSYLRETASSRFYFSPDSRERLKQAIKTDFPHWIRKAAAEGEALCQHRVPLFGRGFDLGYDIDWHRDPLTRRQWPLRFWSRYDPVHECVAGDVKFVYELNRHQHLPRLAKAYFLTGDERYAREAVHQMRSWMHQNPAGIGINWHSSLEIAVRAISWLWTIFLLEGSQSLDEESARRAGQSLVAQLDHVYDHPSTFRSPNTHLIGEAAALFIAGTVLKELEHADAWREFGASVLLGEMDKQVGDDGVHAELSTVYHCYTADFYIQAWILAGQNGAPFPDWVKDRVSRMLEFVMHITRPDGLLPQMGDNDGGRALALASTNYASFADGLCTWAVMSGRSDFKYAAGPFREETMWLLGDKAWDVYSRLEGSPPNEHRVLCPGAGYAVQRSGWGRRDSHLVFDFGGLGMLNGGHGHADTLSLAMSAGGIEMLTDSGTFLYNGAAEWRDSFRGTSAHNTVTVDGQDQSEPGDTFTWKSKARCRIVKRLSLPDLEWIEAEHDGYRRLPHAITHRRRLLYLPPNRWVLVDKFIGSGRHRFDFYFHFAPGTEVVLENSSGGIRVEARRKGAVLPLFLSASEPLEAEIVSGQTEPIHGWHSTLYGEKQPAPVLCATLHANAPAGAMCVLGPSFQQDEGV